MWGTLLLLVSWVFPKIASRLFLNGEPHILVSKKLWLLFVHMRIRTIWRERNRWIFDNHNENFQSIRDCFSFPSCCAKSNPLYSMYTVGSFMSYLGSFLLLPEIAAWCTHFFLFSINEVSFVDKKKEKKRNNLFHLCIQLTILTMNSFVQGILLSVGSLCINQPDGT